MTLVEGHKLALKTLKQVMEEKLDENNVQLAQVRELPRFEAGKHLADITQVTADRGFEILGVQQLKDVIEAIAA
jgi:20S proteasome subunit alpha 5